jgi:hypothetical protein
MFLMKWVEKGWITEMRRYRRRRMFDWDQSTTGLEQAVGAVFKGQNSREERN